MNPKTMPESSMIKIQSLKSATVGCQINQKQDVTRDVSKP